MKILVAVEDSQCSQAAVDAVADRSWPEGTQFKVVSVVDVLIAQFGFADAYAVESILAAQKAVQDQRQHLIDKQVKRLGVLFGQGRVSGELFEGDAAEVIIEQAKSWRADLIVLGTHGRTGLQKFFIGSVAEKVLSNAPCSIEIVKIKSTALDDTQKKAATRKKASLLEPVNKG